MAGTIAALATIALAAPATASVSAPTARVASSVSVAATIRDNVAIASTACASHLGQNFYCDYVHTGFSGRCLIGEGNSPDWGTCRNVDESFINNTSKRVRIYFGPNFGDPHACIPPNTDFSTFAGLDFNSGTGANTQPITNNIASSTESTSPCTNPL